MNIKNKYIGYMIKRYNGFLVEKLSSELLLILEGSIEASGDFTMKLDQISKSKGKVGKIASSIVNTISDGSWVDDDRLKQNYFDVTNSDDKVSFLLQSKSPPYSLISDDPSLPYTVKGRSEIKVGRIIKNIIDAIDDLDFKVSDKDIEDFVNAYKATKIDDSLEFKLVTGKNIAKYYNEDKYVSSESGALGGSCMKDEGKKFFELYTENPKKVNLLIYVNSDDKILGRALVWKLSESPCDAKYFMDRVYTNRDSDVIKFKKFAEDKGWLCKQRMNAYIDKNVFFIYKGQEVLGEVRVKLDGDTSHDQYPFVDTMCFMDIERTYLSNLAIRGGYYLHSVSGECEICARCGGSVKTDYGSDGLCYDCGEGHISLAKHNIPTEYNGLFK